MTQPYRPGEKVKRFYAGYNAKAEGLWQAYKDMYAAHYYGYEETRQPRPGEAIDRERFNAWQNRVVAYLRKEAETRDIVNKKPTKKPAEVGDIPDHLWEYLYQRCLGVSERTKPKVGKNEQ